VRRGLLWFGYCAIAAISIWLVVRKARRDSADPSRCVGLVALGNRCCAAGQTLHEGACVGRPSACPSPLVVSDLGCAVSPLRVLIAPGKLHVGAGDWEAEGRIVPHEAILSAFEIDAYEITEGAYEECVLAQSCPAVPISGEPGRALAGISRPDAEAYCAFRGGRLPTDDEWTFSAGGDKPRRYPWGDTGAVCRRGAWGLQDGPCGFDGAGPELAGAHPDGTSPEGVHDLAGNVAEWVAGSRDEAANEALGAVRGGSFRSGLATELRTWQARSAPVGARLADVGARCAYDKSPESAEASVP
jgi:formylglycine-generating enzyme required for sulfatase activity